MDTSVIVSLITLVGVIYGVWYQRRQTPAQKERDVIANYALLLAEYRLRISEQETENNSLEKELKDEREARAIADANHEAVLKKREIEYTEELRRTRKETEAYQIGYAKLRRVAVRYIPADIEIPEVNGRTTQDVVVKK